MNNSNIPLLLVQLIASFWKYDTKNTGGLPI